MAKFEPGIPDAFTLDVQPVTDLGDYLDEPSPIPQRRAKPQTADVEARRVGERNEVEHEAPPKTSAPVESQRPGKEPAPERTIPVEARGFQPSTLQSTRPVAPAATAESAPRSEGFRPAVEAGPPPVAQTQPQIAVNEDRSPRPKAPRREMSMTPETLRMSDELLDVIRSGSGQRDTKANELFHALVLLAHEAVDELDVHAIPKRGRWGSPTARAYPVELKNAFLKALLRKHGADFGRPPSV